MTAIDRDRQGVCNPTPTQQYADDTHRVPTRPAHPPVQRGRCGAGIVPCGADAQLFASGWRCPAHSPSTLRRRAHLTVVR